MGKSLGAKICRTFAFSIIVDDKISCRGGAFGLKRAIFLVAILLLPIVIAEQFPIQHQNSGFIGWQIESSEKIGEYRLSYPSVSDGEEINMAQNGPFAIVVFYADDGEDIDQYAWLQDGLSKWGYITLVVEDQTDWRAIEYQLTGWNNGKI